MLHSAGTQQILGRKLKRTIATAFQSCDLHGLGFIPYKGLQNVFSTIGITSVTMQHGAIDALLQLAWDLLSEPIQLVSTTTNTSDVHSNEQQQQQQQQHNSSTTAAQHMQHSSSNHSASNHSEASSSVYHSSTSKSNSTNGSVSSGDIDVVIGVKLKPLSSIIVYAIYGTTNSAVTSWLQQIDSNAAMQELCVNIRHWHSLNARPKTGTTSSNTNRKTGDISNSNKHNGCTLGASPVNVNTSKNTSNDLRDDMPPLASITAHGHSDQHNDTAAAAAVAAEQLRRYHQSLLMSDSSSNSSSSGYCDDHQHAQQHTAAATATAAAATTTQNTAAASTTVGVSAERVQAAWQLQCERQQALQNKLEAARQRRQARDDAEMTFTPKTNVQSNTLVARRSSRIGATQSSRVSALATADARKAAQTAAMTALMTTAHRKTSLIAAAVSSGIQGIPLSSEDRELVANCTFKPKLYFGSQQQQQLRSSANDSSVNEYRLDQLQPVPATSSTVHRRNTWTASVNRVRQGRIKHLEQYATARQLDLRCDPVPQGVQDIFNMEGIAVPNDSVLHSDLQSATSNSNGAADTTHWKPFDLKLGER
jgi:hypothetical protein